MAWPTPTLDALPAFTRGFRTQWLLAPATRRFPGLLALLGHHPRWLAALAQARAAATSPEARILMTGLEAELAIVTGHSAIVWPPRSCAACAGPRSSRPDLQTLAPGARLLLDPGPDADPATRTTVAILCTMAFGDRAAVGQVDRLTRIRAAGAVMPTHHRERWAGDTTLEPPTRALKPARRQVAALIRAALPGQGCRRVDLAQFPALSVAEALDALLGALCARAALRLHGEAPVTEPAATTAPPADASFPTQSRVEPTGT